MSLPNPSQSKDPITIGTILSEKQLEYAGWGVYNNSLIAIPTGATAADGSPEYIVEAAGSPDADPLIAQAIAEIYATYGDKVSVRQKAKSLLKFGRNEAVGTNAAGYTIMALPAGVQNETYVDGNLITHVSSSDPADTQTIQIEGHTLSGGNFTFQTQPVTLNGQNKVALTTSLSRISRGYNDNSTDFAGAVYVYEDDTVTGGVPNTAAKVHMIIPAGVNQSLKAATTLSSVDYWIITGCRTSVLEKTAAYVDITFESRAYGKVFRPIETYAATSASAPSEPRFTPYKIIPKNSDVRLRGIASALGTDVSGSMHGFLATVVS